MGIKTISRKVAKEFNITNKDAQAVTESVLQHICEDLTAGETVSLKGFGVFKTRQLGERTIKNPRTKEPVVLAPSKRILFTASSVLKSSVNGGVIPADEDGVEGEDGDEVVSEAAGE